MTSNSGSAFSPPASDWGKMTNSDEEPSGTNLKSPKNDFNECIKNFKVSSEDSKSIPQLTKTSADDKSNVELNKMSPI